MNIRTRSTNIQTPLVKELFSIKFLVVHCSDTFDKPLEVIHSELVNRREFFGYHYLIRENGNIEEGVKDNLIGRHCIGYDYKSIGIALTGYLNLYPPTFQQLTSLSLLIRHYKKLHPDINVVGHRQLNPVLCPGRYFNFNELNKILEDR